MRLWFPNWTRFNTPLVLDAVASIFPQIAAMKAGRARRIGEGPHLRDRISDRQHRDPAHQRLTRLLPRLLQAKAVLEIPEQRRYRPSLGISADHQQCKFAAAVGAGCPGR